MGVLKEIFSGGIRRPGLKVDYVRDEPARPDGTKAFDESSHPRGQPGNAGQFGPGGGGGPAKPAKPAPAPAKPSRPPPHQVAEAAANRVADKMAAGRPLRYADEDAIYNAINHLDRGQLDALMARMKLPPIAPNKGGRSDAVLDAVDAHVVANPHPPAKAGAKIDLPAAQPVDYSGKPADQIHGWGSMSEVDSRMRSFGAVLMRNDPQTGKPQIMLREPANHYGGFAWTFPQGRPNDDKDEPAAVAHREVGEETGLSGHIIGHIPQTFPQVFSHGDHIENAYFLMKHDGGDPDIRKIDAETNDAQWVDLDSAHTLIQQSTNRAGRERDLDVLDAVRKQLGVQPAAKPGQTTKDWDEGKHPRADDGKFGSGSGGHSSDGHGAHGGTSAAGSKGKGEHPHVRTPEFKAWFGDWENDPASASKVVDKSGAPQEQHGTAKPVFHGRGGKFEAFNKRYIGENGAHAGAGFYFAEDRRIADTFAALAGDEGNVLEAFLSIKNPYDFDSHLPGEEISRLADVAGKKLGGRFDAESFKENIDRRNRAGQKITGSNVWYTLARSCRPDPNDDEPAGEMAVNGVLAAAGYDGVTHKATDSHGSVHSGDDEDFGRVWVAFEPTQIKSTENRGTFGPNNPNMHKAAKDWDEGKHPRANDGKFGSGSGGANAEPLAVGVDAHKIDVRDPDGDREENPPNEKLPEAARPPITKTAAHALVQYSNHSEEINALLRGQEVDSPDRMLAHHERMQAAFSSATPFAEPVTVYRSLQLTPDQAKQFEEASVAAHKSGGEFEMPGYVSTSTKELWDTNVTYRIKATEGLDMKPYSLYPHEDELLLNHLSRFKVTGVSSSDGKLIVDLQQVARRQK